MALKGIYSHWITEDILAMARPNSAQIEVKYLQNIFLNTLLFLLESRVNQAI